MRHYTFYILVALLTFSIGSLIVFCFHTDSPEETKNNTKFLLTEINGKWQFVPVKKLPESQINSSSQDKVEKRETTEFRKPFCRDKRILPVWTLMQKDQYFKRQSGGRFIEPNCADMFEVFYYDLNQDGKNEILLRGKSPDLCGAVGNCGFWIFEKRGKKYRKILTDADYAEITEMGNQIRREKTNGYHQIITKGHWNVSDTRHSIFVFNGQRYVESKCLVDYYVRGTTPDPKWKFITCGEYEKLENY